MGSLSCISMGPSSISAIRSFWLTGENSVRPALISRSAQRRRIAVSRLKPSSAERGCSAIVVVFSQSPQSRLRWLFAKPKDRRRSLGSQKRCACANVRRDLGIGYLADLANVCGRPPVLRPIFQTQQGAGRLVLWTARPSYHSFLPCGFHREAFAIRDSALRGWRPCVHF